MEAEKTQNPPAPEPVPQTPAPQEPVREAQISYDTFRKTVLKIATIKQVDVHPKADRLWVVTVDTGSAVCTVVAGIKAFYTPEQLVGRQVILVENLVPAVIRGVESQGMILAASDEQGMSVLGPDRRVQEGSLVK